MEILKFIFLLLFILGAIMYVLGVALSNTRFGDAVVNLWGVIETTKSRNHRQDIFMLAELFLDAFYRKNGKLSFLKLLYITVVLNGMFLFSVLFSDVSSIQNSEMFEGEIDLEIAPSFIQLTLVGLLVFFSFIAAYFAELSSYVVTSHLVKRASLTGKLFPLLVDTFILLVLFLLVPVFFAMDSLGYFSIPENLNYLKWPIGFLTPYTQIFVFGGFVSNTFSYSEPFYYLSLASILSVCFPTMLVLTSSILVYNRKFATIFAEKLVALDSLNHKSLREYGIAICAITSGLVTILWA